MSLSGLVCAQVIENLKRQYDQMLEVADQGWETEAQFREYCEELCHMTMRVAKQLEGNNVVKLDVDDMPLPEDIKGPLSKVRDIAKRIRSIVSCVVNDQLWFDFHNPRHLQVFRLGLREEIQKMSI